MKFDALLKRSRNFHLLSTFSIKAAVGMSGAGNSPRTSHSMKVTTVVRLLY